jgi:hypothetical protein
MPTDPANRLLQARLQSNAQFVCRYVHLSDGFGRRRNFDPEQISSVKSPLSARKSMHPELNRYQMPLGDYRSSQLKSLETDRRIRPIQTVKHMLVLGNLE